MYAKIIEGSIIVLLIYAPLASGAVSPFSRMLIESVAALLMLIWMIKMIVSHKDPPDDSLTQINHTNGQNSSPRSSWYLTGIIGIFALAIGLFLCVVFAQLLPLPASFVQQISPARYQLHAETAQTLNIPMSAVLSLSVSTQATEEELYLDLAYAAIFFLMITSFRTHQQVNRVMAVIIGVSFLEAFYGLISSFSNQTGAWVSGTYINRNHFAGYLEMGILLAWGVLFSQFEMRDPNSLQRLPNLFDDRYAKFFAFCCPLLFTICAHLSSGSRGGMIGLTFGLLVFAFLLFRRQFFHRWMGVFLKASPVIIAIILFAVNPAGMFSRVNSLVNFGAEDSFIARKEVWKSALQIWQDFPLIGSGAGTFSHLSRRYQSFRTFSVYEYVENDYGQLFAETGFIGLSVFAAIAVLFILIILIQWKRRHSQWAITIVAGELGALSSLAMHSGLDFHAHIPANALTFTVIAALTYVTVTTHRHRHRAPSSQQGSLNMPIPLKITIVIALLLYTLQVISTYRNFVRYETFTQAIPKSAINTIEPSQAAQLIELLRTAMRYDRNNAEYPYALGSFLYQYYSNPPQTVAHDLQEQHLREAEQLLKQAVMLDPVNPWYYYQLGRASHTEAACSNQRQNDCPTTRYFLAALRNAPQNTSLAKLILPWIYYYDQETAHKIIGEILAEPRGNFETSDVIIKELSRLFYDLRLDYFSDREIAKIVPAEKQSKCAGKSENPDMSARLELASDDGSAEWTSPIWQKTYRIEKDICLPANIGDYRTAALRIYMNRVGTQDISVQITLDARIVFQGKLMLSNTAGWYDIPIDPASLAGKTGINVYIRLLENLMTGNALQLWGDQDTLTGNSSFNFHATDDLSMNDGIQRGEYLMRLVLKK